MISLADNIRNRHSHNGEVDQGQVEAIYAPESHLIIEAPAGYGKTRTMISKLAYLIASGSIPYPKKILALTFSINAAFLIRKEVGDNLPLLLAASPKLARQASSMVASTNYHGFCRKILSNYGHLISPELSQIDSLKAIGIDVYEDAEYTRTRLQSNVSLWGVTLTDAESAILIDFSRNIRTCANKASRPQAARHISTSYLAYLEIVKRKFLPKGYVLFDSILLFVLQLFEEKSPILDFYRRYFPVIVVDEFQDTNILQWRLLNALVGKPGDSQNSFFLFGDPHQRIYDFIGALDGVMNEARTMYSMREIKLATNHRFKNVPSLLDFDRNIRLIAQDPQSIPITDPARLNVLFSPNQNDESERVLEKVRFLLQDDPGCSVAILTRAGKDNSNTKVLVEHLNAETSNDFSYFFALYSDEDQEYIDFHHKCLAKLYENLRGHPSFRNLHSKTIKDMEADSPTETWASLLALLDTFFTHTSKEFRFLSLEERVELLIDTLKNKALKQYLMYVTTAQVMLSTIHGSKGLEWDYVILPDMERYSFPTYPGLCRVCNFHERCAIDWDSVNSDFLRQYKQEINLFYVGGTRARKAVFFTYSAKGLNSSGGLRTNNPSCFLNIEGTTILIA